MNIFLDMLYLLLIGITFLLSVPLIVVTGQLMTSLFIRKKTAKNSNDQAIANFAILMPAHNEEFIIAETLTKLIPQIESASDIYLVADNCEDSTAHIANTFGVNVIERHDPIKKGKGYALTYGLEVLKLSKKQYQCVIILDADCEIDKSSLDKLAIYTTKNNAPVQALYLMRVPSGASIKQRVAGFAWFVKNKLRPLSMNAMQLPITLTGTGMAFPLGVLTNVDFDNGNIVEDMQLGIDLTMQGHPPHFLPDAVVYSDFPQSTDAQSSQRARWEHGHIRTILNVVPKMINSAIKTKSFKLFALALDIAVPPLALLVLISFSYFCFLVFCGLLFDIEQLLICYTLLIGLFFTSIFLVWIKYGREYLSLRDFLSLPYYVISKIGLYVDYFRKKQLEWIKTKRDG